MIDPSNLTPLTDWIGDLIPSSIDDFRPDVHAECPAYPSTAGSGPFDACATVPVFLHAADASPTGNITFAAENIFDPSTWDGEVDPSIVTAILGQPLDWTTIVHGLHTVTHNLQDALDASAYGGADLPVIGHSLDAGAQIVEKLNTNFVDPLNDLATSLEGVATFDGVADLIRNTIWDHLGQPGANLVLPYDADAPDGTVPAASDIKVTFRCGSDLHICDATSGDTVSAIMNAEISLGIGGSIADAKFKFDSGFPGLRLTMDKEIKAGVDFRYDLTFGLSRSRGFYVRTDEPADTHRDKELTVNAHVHLPNDGTHGDLAFLRIDVSNNNTADDYADLGLELAADVKGGQTDADGATKLAFSDLTASDPIEPGRPGRDARGRHPPEPEARAQRAHAREHRRPPRRGRAAEAELGLQRRLGLRGGHQPQRRAVGPRRRSRDQVRQRPARPRLVLRRVPAADRARHPEVHEAAAADPRHGDRADPGLSTALGARGQRQVDVHGLLRAGLRQRT